MKILEPLTGFEPAIDFRRVITNHVPYHSAHNGIYKNLVGSGRVFHPYEGSTSGLHRACYWNPPRMIHQATDFTCRFLCSLDTSPL